MVGGMSEVWRVDVGISKVLKVVVMKKELGFL